MKKEKIKVGQCYRWDDHVYMVVGFYGRALGEQWWVVEDTINKCPQLASAEFLQKQQRPFQNEG